jgi:hypothetical protein
MPAIKTRSEQPFAVRAGHGAALRRSALWPWLHQLVTSAAYSSALSSQAKCPASMRWSVLFGSLSWRNSALTGPRWVSRAGDDLRRSLDLGQEIAGLI